jgi:hypothetical protein
MAADIFTKAFADKVKWQAVCDLINHVDLARLKDILTDNSAVLNDEHPSPLRGGTQAVQNKTEQKNAVQNRKGKSGGGPRVAAVPPTGGSGGGPRVAAMPSQILPTGGPRVAGDKTDEVCSLNVGGPRVADGGSTCDRSYVLTAKQKRALVKGLMTIAWEKVPPSSDDGGGQEIRRIILGSTGEEPLLL